jgi:hypothetical protein
VQLLLEGERGDVEVGASDVPWSPGQSEAQATVDVRMEGRPAQGRAVLRVQIDRDANERDNSAWAVMQVRERLRVALVGTRRFGERPRISEFGPTDWLALALRPTDAEDETEIEVDVLDAARLDGAQLAGFDAVVVGEPDRVQAQAWDALGAFSARGGAVMLCAAPDAGAQLWVERATASLGLPWVIDREPAALEEGRVHTATPGESDLLWYLRGELADLAETVSVQRALGVRADDAASVLLHTGGGQPLLLATAPETQAGATGHGVVVLLAVAIDLDWTDLPARPLMVPLIQELVRTAVGSAGTLHGVLAGARVPAPGGAVEIARIAPAAEASPIGIDPSTGLSRDAVRAAGAYEARDAAGRGVGYLTVHPHAPTGHARITDRDRVAAWLATAAGDPDRFGWLSQSGTAAPRPSGAPPRPADAGPGLALLAAALAVACVELWLARIVSHAARPREGGLAEAQA